MLVVVVAVLVQMLQREGARLLVLHGCGGNMVVCSSCGESKRDEVYERRREHQHEQG